MCDDVSDCNNRGYCINNQCLCDVAWFGNTCSDNLEIFLPRGFSGYRAVFLIIYSVILITSFLKLYMKLKEEKYMFHGSTCMFIFKAMRSPFNLSMLSIFTIATTRMIWLSIDPFGYNHILHRSLERLLFELTYSLLFLVYAVVLLVWHRIYEELRDDKPLVGHNRISQDLNISDGQDISAKKKAIVSYANSQWVSNKIKVFVLLVFVAQITTSISKGFYNTHYRWFTIAVYIVLFVFLIVITLEYLIFGWLIHRIIKRQQKKIKEYEKSIDMLTAGKPVTGHLANVLLGKKPSDRPKGESGIKDSEANELNGPDRSDIQRTNLASPANGNIQLTTRTVKTEDMKPGKHKTKAKSIGQGSLNTMQVNNQQSSDSEDGEISQGAKPTDNIFAAALTKSEVDSYKVARKDTKNRHTVISTGFEKTLPKQLKKQGSTGRILKSDENLPKKSRFHDKKERTEIRLKEDLEREERIQILLSSDMSNTKPASVPEVNIIGDDIAVDVSLIIHNEYNLDWDPVDLEKLKESKFYQIRQEQRKQEIEKDYEKTKEELARGPKVKKTPSNNSAAGFKLDDYQKMLFKDHTFRRNYLDITEHDQKVMRKISTLTVIAIVLEIIFAVVSVVVFQTKFLQNPGTMIFVMWLIGFLEVASIFAIIILFSMVHSQKNKNLQLVMTIGQSSNRINQLYQFKLPQYMTGHRKDSEFAAAQLVKSKSGPNSKKLLQDNINKITSRYIKKLSVVIRKATQK